MKKSYPTQTITSVDAIEARLQSVNLGGESSPIDADFEGIVSGTLQLSVYSGLTSKQADGTDDENNLRPYEVASLEIVGDVIDSRDNSTLTNKKVKVSKTMFDILKANNQILDGKVSNIPTHSEKWEQSRMEAGVMVKVPRYRLTTKVVEIAPTVNNATIKEKPATV